MGVIRFSLRAMRKTAHVSNKIFTKGQWLTDRVETKATNILDGVDYTLKANHSIPLEKLYYSAVPYTLPIHASMPAVGAKPTVTLLIPSLGSGSFFGGTATALVVAAKLALMTDRKLRVVQTLKTGSHSSLSKFLSTEGITLPEERIQVISIAERAYNVYGYISMHPEDIFIASAWWDAYNLSKMPLQNKFVYLVQDFEPIFYNNSDLYVLAEATYKGDMFVPLCNTKLMASFMNSREYPAFRRSPHFEPAVSRLKSGGLTAKKPKEKKVLFLYGRPNVHRNMFFTALQAIDQAFTKGYLQSIDWECYMAGQDNLPDITLSSGVVVKNKGKMSMDKYVAFSKSVDLAVSPMMAPHPNYPTLEFASIGSMVVTTKYANKQSLNKYSKNIIMSEIDVDSMAGAIKKAAAISDKVRHENLKNSTISASWDDSLDKPLQQVLTVLKRKKRATQSTK